MLLLVMCHLRSRGGTPRGFALLSFLDAARREILRDGTNVRVLRCTYRVVMHARGELEAQFRELEESHLRPEARSSPEALRFLLADDFLAIGSSGRLWNRDQTIEALSGEVAFTASIEHLTVQSLAPGVALTTYRLVITSGGARTTRRSSIWVHRGGRWLLLFHQGTPVSTSGDDR